MIFVKIMVALLGICTWSCINHKLILNPECFVGKFSMGIYLLHLPVIYVFLHALPIELLTPTIVMAINFKFSILVSVITQKILKSIKCSFLIGI